MTKDEALKLAYDETWSAGSEYPIPSFDDVMSFANKLEAIKEALAQQALDRKAENARELGLDYEPAGHGGRPMTLRECMEAEEPEQEPCGGCGGSGWVTRDPDIGTDQECFVCGGSGAQPKEPEQEPVAHWSDCAVHNEPAYPKGECDCGGYSPEKELFDSARSFYNATVADLQVRITSKDQNKRDVASEAANRLRNALLVYKNTTPPPVAEPHKRKPLTDEEILVAVRDHYNPHQRAEISFARAIEEAHGIKE